MIHTKPFIGSIFIVMAPRKAVVFQPNGALIDMSFNKFNRSLYRAPMLSATLSAHTNAHTYTHVFGTKLQFSVYIAAKDARSVPHYAVYWQGYRWPDMIASMNCSLFSDLDFCFSVAADGL